MHTINPSITILISLSYHLINFVVSQFLANGCHNVTELRSGDETVVISVEDLCSRSLSLNIHLSRKAAGYICSKEVP